MKKSLIFVLIPILFLMSSCYGTQTVTSGNNAQGTLPNTIVMDNYAFNPDTLAVNAGTEIIWINNQGVPHHIVSQDGLFESSDLNKGDDFKFTFANPGEYSYYCKIHPSMKGKIIVK